MVSSAGRVMPRMFQPSTFARPEKLEIELVNTKPNRDDSTLPC